MSTKNSLLFDLATASSVVTLNYLRLFRERLFASRADSYYLPVYGFADYVIGLVLIIGLSVLCCVTIRGVRKIGSPVFNVIASGFLFVALAGPVEFVSLTLQFTPEDALFLFSRLPAFAKAGIAMTFPVFVAMFVRLYWQLVRAVRLLFVAAFPFTLSVVLQLSGHAVASLASDAGASKHRAATVRSAWTETGRSTTGSRVLVLVFDELDYRLVFPERPEFVKLPEFDRVFEQTVAFTKALPLASETRLAIPALLVGKPVTGVTIAGRQTLMLQFAGSQNARSLSSMPTLFSEARKAGHTFSIVGYYHPYCRLFAGLYTECLQSSEGDPYVSGYRLGEPVSGMRSLFEKLKSAVLQGFPGTKVGRVWQYGVILRRVKEMVRTFEVNLLFVHVQLPHRPNIFDAGAGRMSYFNFSPLGYFDNLVLTDKFLGEIRAALEGAGIWDSTTLLLTSDHPWRAVERYDGKSDSRIPILLKMPGQRESIAYTQEFSSEHVKELVLAILAERIVDPASVIAWLQNR
jgi:hypothetical protein